MFSSIPFGAAAAMDSSPSQARVAAGGSHAHQQARAAAWLAAFGRSQRDYIGRTTERSLGRAELLALLSALPNSVGSASTAATELLSEGRPGVDHTRPGDPRMGAAGLLRAVADGLLPALPAQVPAAPVAPVTVRQRLNFAAAAPSAPPTRSHMTDKSDVTCDSSRVRRMPDLRRVSTVMRA